MPLLQPTTNNNRQPTTNNLQPTTTTAITHVPRYPELSLNYISAP